MKNLFFVFWLATSMAMAQSQIVFEKTSHNFGSIKEENGPVTYVFKFRNTGKESVKLLEVKPSCGCTTPDWSKDEVPSGGEGYISATYDPTARPGKFDKYITVRTNGSPAILSLQISGEVIPRPKGPADWYPTKRGNLRMTTDYIFFGDVLHDQTDTASIVLYNEGSVPISFRVEQMPVHLKMEAEGGKMIVEPLKTLKLNFKFDAKLKNDWGYVFDVINLETDDRLEPRKRLNLSAQIKENFAGVKISDAPKVSFDKKEHNFGDVLQNSQNTTTFEIKNIGNSPLIIRKCKASCGCTATQPKKMTLQPGESTTIEVSYSSGMQEGIQNKTVTIICNDPTAPEHILNIKANVLKPTQK